jgi:trimethylamine--corrinoid protein Co-methyltransferase
VIEQQFTDSWLALRGYDIPVAIMPMPLMGATAPASMVSTIVQANAETLGTICLVQAADPGTPIIYAPVFAAMDPRSGRLGGGAIEHAVMAAAGTELARFYGLAVEASGCGTDHYVPGIQATYEKATTAMMSALSWPDILVGPGTLGGSLILSFEQLMLDVELFRILAHAQRGVPTAEDRWLDEAFDRVRPAGNYLAEQSTRKHARDGEWFLSELGTHETYDAWDAGGRVTIEEQAREKVDTLLATHEPPALDADVVKELGKLQKKADEALASV